MSEIQIEAQQLENYFESVKKFLAENGVPSLIEAEAQVQSQRDLTVNGLIALVEE